MRLGEPFRRDVSATPDELRRWVFAAYPESSYRPPGSYLIESGTAALELTATVGPPRRIALLSLPTLCIDYRFLHGSEAARHQLLQRLDQFMHRGGG